MALQAFVDNSGSSAPQKLFVLAGALAAADDWAQFSNEWDEALKREPRLEYFKYREAVLLEGQFDGWTEGARNAPVETLVAILKGHAIAAFGASVRHDHFQKYVRSVPAPSRELLSHNPYLFCAGQVVIAAAEVMAGHRLTDRCDFYFDRQDGYSIDLHGYWPLLEELFLNPPEGWFSDGDVIPKINGSPRFENDLDFRPLQAADMIAGATRSSKLEGGVLPVFAGLSDLTYRFRQLDETEVKRMGDGLVRAGKRWLDANPDLKLVKLGARRMGKRKKD